jgi:hypothetical protein
VYGHLVEQFSVETSDVTMRPVAQPHRAAGNGVEHRLDVGRRTGDHPEDFGGGGLLLQRFGDLGVGRG